MECASLSPPVYMLNGFSVNSRKVSAIHAKQEGTPVAYSILYSLIVFTRGLFTGRIFLRKKTISFDNL